MIVALMGAAALLARQRRHRDGFRDLQHVAQIKPVDQQGIKAHAGRGRRCAKLAGHAVDLHNRLGKLVFRAEGSDLVGHQRLQITDGDRPIGRVALVGAAQQINGRRRRRIRPVGRG